MQLETIIGEAPSELGGHTAISQVPGTYKGVCSVIEASGSGRIVAVLSSFAEACRVARYAISAEGGYGSVIVDKSNLPVTHSTFDAWL